jgi:hypothetical protein
LNSSHESQRALFSAYFSIEDGSKRDAGALDYRTAVASVEHISEGQKLRDAEKLAALRTEQLMRVQAEAQKAKKVKE